VVYVSTNAASPEPRTAIPTIITPRQIKDIRSSRMAIRGPMFQSASIALLRFRMASCEDENGFVRHIGMSFAGN
jgi:hypothetical protein